MYHSLFNHSSIEGHFGCSSLVAMQIKLLLLLLPSHFSHVRLCATPWTAAHQASPSMGFSRQNTGVGCHFLLQCMKVESESGVAQSCLTLSNPMDCSLPGSSIHGIFRATVLEWGAIAFSNKVAIYSHIQVLCGYVFISLG